MIGNMLVLKLRTGKVEQYEIVGWNKNKGYVTIYYKNFNKFQPIYENLIVNEHCKPDDWYLNDNELSYQLVCELIKDKEDRHMPNDIYVIFSQSDSFLDKHGKKTHMDFLYINQLDNIDEQNKAIENIIFETKEEAMRVYSTAYIDLSYDILEIDIESIIELIVNYKSYKKCINRLYSLNPMVIK